MPYRKPHFGCSKGNCQSYSAYIRVKKKWVKAGEYNSKCRSFTPDENVKTYSEIQDEALKQWVEERREFLEGMIGKHSNV